MVVKRALSVVPSAEASSKATAAATAAVAIFSDKASSRDMRMARLLNNGGDVLAIGVRTRCVNSRKIYKPLYKAGRHAHPARSCQPAELARRDVSSSGLGCQFGRLTARSLRQTEIVFTNPACLMTLLRSPAFRRYSLAMACTLTGAGLTESTGSWWPLALGASVLVMSTVRWVQHVRRQAEQRRHR